MNKLNQKTFFPQRDQAISIYTADRCMSVKYDNADRRDYGFQVVETGIPEFPFAVSGYSVSRFDEDIHGPTTADMTLSKGAVVIGFNSQSFWVIAEFGKEYEGVAMAMTSAMRDILNRDIGARDFDVRKHQNDWVRNMGENFYATQTEKQTP